MVRGKKSNEGGLGLKDIPSGSMEMVMSLKEIVNCSVAEIYATLKDCNMDPNRALNKLISQDSFVEVKSKREKKKENKDTAKGRTRRFVGTSSRGDRSGTRRYGRGGPTQFGFSDPAVSYGKSAYKKDNGSTSYPASSSSVPGTTGNTYEGPPRISDSALTSIKASTTNTGDGLLPVAQPSQIYQPGWVAAPGKMSMENIVGMGKPQNKSSGAVSASDHHGPRTLNSSSEVNPSPVVSTTLEVSVKEECPSIEPTSTPYMSFILEPPSDSKHHDDAPYSQYNIIGKDGHDDDILTLDHNALENVGSNHVGSASVSDGRLQEENDDSTSLFDNDMYQNRRPYQPHNREYHEVEEPGLSVSSMTAEVKQFNIEDDRGFRPEDIGSSVIIPDHIKVQTGDFPHFSFGSFKFGSTYSAPLTSIPVTNIGEVTIEADGTTGGQSEASADHFKEGSCPDVADENLYHRAGANTSNDDSSSASQQEPHENPEVEHVNQYASCDDTHEPKFESSQAYAGPQMQNYATSATLQGDIKSLPTTFLAANGHSGEEIDFPYSRFSMDRSVPSKYAKGASSIGGSEFSYPEDLETIGYSLAQPTQQSLSRTNGAPGPDVPQHLAMHPNSQSTQAFPGNNYKDQSLAAAVLRHKMSMRASKLRQSASGYDAFRSSTASTRNFTMNQTAAAALPGTAYDDILSSQYMDNSHLRSLQQSENSAMWLQRLGSRISSAVPTNMHYGMQEQSRQALGLRRSHQALELRQRQQALGLRQSQQPSQNYATRGYPHSYDAQAGISVDHHQQQPSQNYATRGYPNSYDAQAGISVEHHHHQQPNPRDASRSYQGQQNQSEQLFRKDFYSRRHI